MDEFIYSCGITFIALVIYISIIILWHHIKRILKKQTKIKCLCRHEYEPCSAFYFKGIEYEFKCRKCNKKISVKTVSDDKFRWIEKE